MLLKNPYESGALPLLRYTPSHPDNGKVQNLVRSYMNELAAARRGEGPLASGGGLS